MSDNVELVNDRLRATQMAQALVRFQRDHISRFPNRNEIRKAIEQVIGPIPQFTWGRISAGGDIAINTDIYAALYLLTGDKAFDPRTLPDRRGNESIRLPSGDKIGRKRAISEEAYEQFRTSEQGQQVEALARELRGDNSGHLASQASVSQPLSPTEALQMPVILTSIVEGLLGAFQQLGVQVSDQLVRAIRQAIKEEMQLQHRTKPVDFTELGTQLSVELHRLIDEDPERLAELVNSSRELFLDLYALFDIFSRRDWQEALKSYKRYGEVKP